MKSAVAWLHWLVLHSHHLCKRDLKSAKVPLCWGGHNTTTNTFIEPTMGCCPRAPDKCCSKINTSDMSVPNNSRKPKPPRFKHPLVFFQLLEPIFLPVWNFIKMIVDQKRLAKVRVTFFYCIPANHHTNYSPAVEHCILTHCDGWIFGLVFEACYFFQ